MLYDLPAPAKLNRFLHVVGQRPDGYHLLETLFQMVSLSDSISLDLVSHSAITRETNLNQVLSADEDLVVKAAKALQQVTGVSLGAHIVVNKRIPAGAGLGGGSSDAATVLIGLNRLWRCGLTRTQLMRLAVTLGADVPFFVQGQTAFAQGIGEILTPVSVVDQSFLLIKPSQSVATQTIFRAPDLTRQSESVKITDFSGYKSFISQNQVGFGKNDLQSVVFRMYPDVLAVFNGLTQLSIPTRMTGSGSCLFAEFDSPCQAHQARDRLKSVCFGKTIQDIPTQSVSGIGGLISDIVACDSLPEHPLRHWVHD